MKESYICGNNLLEITTENGTLTAETIIDFGKAKKPESQPRLSELEEHS